MRNQAVQIGLKLKRRRELLGLLQPELSMLTGLSSRTIQLVEQGKGNPTINTLIQLSDSLGLQMVLLLKEPGNAAS